MNTRDQSGFTIAEIFIGVVVLIGAGFLVSSQWQYAAASARDEARKTAINAMHFYLREVYSRKNESYPSTLNEHTLQSLRKIETRDPFGRFVSSIGSDLRYEPAACDNGTCRHYTLRANLEQEPDFIRKSE